VRLHYVYPYPHVDKVLPLMAEGKILPYLDIPMQHANTDILKAMKRPAASEKMLNRIASWREICPDMAIRSTFITGFPGESQQQFNELIDFIKEAKLDHVGAFNYSPVDGAKANKIKGHISPSEQQARHDIFMKTQLEISRAKFAERVGQTMDIIIDGYEDDLLVGRSKKDAPEIDGLVYVENNNNTNVGDIISVEISDSDNYDCYGTIKD
jgi:ribosomal protein S12 methylthiotransferase